MNLIKLNVDIDISKLRTDSINNSVSFKNLIHSITLMGGNSEEFFVYAGENKPPFQFDEVSLVLKKIAIAFLLDKGLILQEDYWGFLSEHSVLEGE